MSEFFQVEPTRENYWRAIVLFGRNVASYKFALASALYDLKDRPGDLVTLEELAAPFSRHLCRHLAHSPKQVTSSSSKFLDACTRFNEGTLSEEDLIATTARMGFVNVIDAFHIVGGAEVPKRFFLDERQGSKGIRLTEEFYRLAEGGEVGSFAHETEARWRLVEEGWKLGISRSLLMVEYDKALGELVIGKQERRVSVTSCRDSLNGYQKGRCFYCYQPVGVDALSDCLADVDHFLPWSRRDRFSGVNGVWNLVLACPLCNRGEGGKSDRIPSLELLKRLHRRNEYLIGSHLPLRETLIRQTGGDEPTRRAFLQQQYNALGGLPTWEPEVRGVPTF